MSARGCAVVRDDDVKCDHSSPAHGPTSTRKAAGLALRGDIAAEPSLLDDGLKRALLDRASPGAEEHTAARSSTIELRQAMPSFAQSLREELDSTLREVNFSKDGRERRLAVLHAGNEAMREVLKGYAEGKVSAGELREFDEHIKHAAHEFKIPRSTFLRGEEIKDEIQTFSALRQTMQHYALGTPPFYNERQGAKARGNLEALCILFNVKDSHPPLVTSDGKEIKRLKGDVAQQYLDSARELALESGMELLKRNELTPARQREINNVLSHIQNWNRMI